MGSALLHRMPMGKMYYEDWHKYYKTAMNVGNRPTRAAHYKRLAKKRRNLRARGKK